MATNGESHKDLTYQILPQYHSEPSHIKLVQVGAGAAGLLTAYKLSKTGSNYDLTVYEKNGGVGGTWYENRYPGVACDVPAHVYTYSFEPNPDFTSFYSAGAQIREYFEKFAEKYGLNKYVQLNSRVRSAIWNEEKGVYELEVATPNGPIRDWCHVLINGTGFLNNWKWPEIPGLQTFRGQLVHSANWDSQIEYSNKNVGVIGNGSSAIQIVPQAQKDAKHLTTFIRNETWISPPIGGDIFQDTKKEENKDALSGGSYDYSEEQRRQFAENPNTLLEHRKQLECAINGLFDMFISGSEVSKATEKAMRQEMIRRLGPGHGELKEKLIPTWAPGCHRITPGDGYLEALVEPNVTAVLSGVQEVVENGVIDSTGVSHRLDVLVCATGFNIAFAPPFQLTGRGGVTMQDEWNPEPNCYLGLAAPGFPNYFVINGPRGNWGSGSALPTIELQVEYVLKFVKRLQEEGIKSVEVSQQPTTDLNEHIDVWHQGSVWAEPCKSWYKNNISDGKVWIWAGSALHYMQSIREPKYEHYQFQYRYKNIFAYLGNGYTERQAKHQMDKLAPYIRNSDTPWEF